MALGRPNRAGPMLAEALPLPTVDLPLMARIAAALFAAGGTLGMLTSALPHAAGFDAAGVVAMSAAALVAAAVLERQRRRITLRHLEFALVLGTVLTSGAIHWAGPVSTTYAFFYLWIVLYAGYFLPAVRAALQVGFVVVAYGLVLATKPEIPAAVESWVVATGTLGMAAALFAVVRQRVAALVERLADAATTDSLTGLLNRRGFGTQFELEIERAERSGEPFGVVVGDLDHFKAVNDRFGHHAGDEVLEAVADVLRSRARRIDTVARIGGEEFALLLPSTDAQGAYILAEKLRVAIRDTEASRGLTMSFGVAAHPASGTTVETLLGRADESLYAAKALGRDRTVVYSDEVVGALGGEAHAGRPASNLAALLALAQALDLRDPRSARHSATVARYAEAIARQLGFEPSRVERVRLAGVLHDVGKVGVGEWIMHSPGPLAAEELAEVHEHPRIGARLLNSPGLEDLRSWILAHHERPDGTGYPDGVAAPAIPIEAQVLAVADAFEAMQAERPYGRAMPADEALAELHRCAGTQFDPRVVAALEASGVAGELRAPANAPS